MKYIIIIFITVIVPLSFSSNSHADNIQSANKYFYGKQYDNAIEHYSRALKKSNDNAELLYRIGLSHFLSGNYEKTIEYWDKAEEKDPKILKGRLSRLPIDAMNPTLISGDILIIDDYYYKYNKISHGDIIVFLSPKDKKYNFIKRVIALPGEQVLIKDKKVMINDKPYDESYVIFKDSKIETSVRDNFGPITIPEDKYFVLGDNRDQSYDSRFWGLVDKNYISGKALAIFHSIPKGGSIDDARPERAGRIIK